MYLAAEGALTRHACWSVSRPAPRASRPSRATRAPSVPREGSAAELGRAPLPGPAAPFPAAGGLWPGAMPGGPSSGVTACPGMLPRTRRPLGLRQARKLVLHRMGWRGDTRLCAMWHCWGRLVTAGWEGRPCLSCPWPPAAWARVPQPPRGRAERFPIPGVCDCSSSPAGKRRWV